MFYVSVSFLSSGPLSKDCQIPSTLRNKYVLVVLLVVLVVVLVPEFAQVT